MIRKLASGQFRLYRARPIPRPAKGKTSGPSKAERPQRVTNVRYSISSGTKGEPAELSPQGGADSTNALFSLHEAAVASGAASGPKKKPAGGVWRARGSRCWIGQD